MTSAVSSKSTQFLLLSRRLVFLLFVLAAANGFFLYFVPFLAEDYYAWSIKPPINAAALGAGYLAGMFATGLGSWFVKRWRSVRVLMGPFAVLGFSLFVATLIHASIFRWNYFPTWGWTIVYFGLPIGSLIIWMVQEWGKSEVVPADPRMRGFRVASIALGLPVLLVSLGLYIFPGAFIDAWPWQMTVLLGRAFAGWYIFACLLLVFSGFMLRQAHEALITYGTVALWNFLMLLLPVIYSESIRSGAGLTGFLAVHLALLVLTGWVSISSWRIMKAEKQSL